jgi:tetratricopeptide (TPR) repeat protein
MRRIAILTIAVFAALPAFSQTAPAPAPTAPPQGAAGAPGAPAATPGPHPKSPEENAALVALLNAVGDEDKATSTATRGAAADVVIKDANDLLAKYPDTDYKAIVQMHLAQAYHYKNDDPKAISIGEQSLEGDPNSYETLLLMSEIYSRSTRTTDLDKDDRLAKADKYAKQALTLIPKATKPNPNISDADWAQAQGAENQRAYLSMGYASVVAGKPSDADASFQKAFDVFSPDPVEFLRIARAYAVAKNYDEAIKWDDKAAAQPNMPDQIKSVAASDKSHWEAAKK